MLTNVRYRWCYVLYRHPCNRPACLSQRVGAHVNNYFHVLDDVYSTSINCFVHACFINMRRLHNLIWLLNCMAAGVSIALSIVLLNIVCLRAQIYSHDPDWDQQCRYANDNGGVMFKDSVYRMKTPVSPSLGIHWYIIRGEDCESHPIAINSSYQVADNMHYS